MQVHPAPRLRCRRVRQITLRLSDELHERARQAAGPESLNAYIREAVAEKVSRSEMLEMAERIAELERRVKQLELSQQRSR